jgi:hypothetical protein
VPTLSIALRLPLDALNSVEFRAAILTGVAARELMLTGRILVNVSRRYRELGSETPELPAMGLLAMQASG